MAQNNSVKSTVHDRYCVVTFQNVAKQTLHMLDVMGFQDGADLESTNRHPVISISIVLLADSLKHGLDSAPSFYLTILIAVVWTFVVSDVVGTPKIRRHMRVSRDSKDTRREGNACPSSLARAHVFFLAVLSLAEIRLLAVVNLVDAWIDIIMVVR